MFQYCPSCGETGISYETNRFHCSLCGFIYYHNTAAATGCIIQADDKIVLLVRGREPGRGKLDLPGGFIDPGEGIFEGMHRELSEELGWKPSIPLCKSLSEFYTLFASLSLDSSLGCALFHLSAKAASLKDWLISISQFQPTII